MSEAIATMDFDGFVAAEQRGDVRHELVGGRVYVMAGGSERHDLAAGLIFAILQAGARAKGCRAFTSNRLVRVADATGCYPDVFVACGKAAHRNYETDATTIVEVRSASTADTDRREKAAAYASLPSVTRYLLVDPERPRIEIATFAAGQITWAAAGPGDVVMTPYGDIDVDALYDELDATATT